MEEENVKPIKGIVEGLIENWTKKKVFKKDIIEKAWRKIVGKKAVKHTKISSFRSGKLIVEANESGWIYQLTMKKNSIIKDLNKYLKKSDIEITDMQFRIGNSN